MYVTVCECEGVCLSVGEKTKTGRDKQREGIKALHFASTSTVVLSFKYQMFPRNIYNLIISRYFRSSFQQRSLRYGILHKNLGSGRKQICQFHIKRYISRISTLKRSFLSTKMHQ